MTPARLGALAIALYLPHAIWHLTNDGAVELLWVCNLALPLLAIGCFAKSARAVTVAFLFLAFGTPLWLLDVFAGGDWVPTSPLIHIGGLATAVYAVRALGWPKRTWIVASLASAALFGFTRLATPPAANINMVFTVYKGWERYFPNHAVYVGGLWLIATAFFALLERLLRR